MTDDQIDDFLKGAEFVIPLPGEITQDVTTQTIRRFKRLSPAVRNVVAGVHFRYIAAHKRDHVRHLRPLDMEDRTEGFLAGFYVWDEYLKLCPEPHDIPALADALAARLRRIDNVWEVCVGKAIEGPWGDDEAGSGDEK